MDILENPFTPTFGEIPLFMAGREAIISELVSALKRPSRSPELTTLVSGARGTGKTALLAKIAEEAQGIGWICANVTCADGMLEDIYTLTARAASTLVGNGETKRLTGLGVGQIVSIEWERDRTMPSNWRSRMEDIMNELDPLGTGILITVDEVRPDVPEMIQLASTYQHFVSERKRIALLMAGLPFNVEALRDDKTVSFVRRAQLLRIGRVPDFEVRNALEKTIHQSGRRATANTLDYMTESIEGFPFMMQLVGYRTWNRRPESDEISLQDSHEGAKLARLELRERILEPTYRELSDGDIAFLSAMLQDDQESSLSDIAKRMGKTSGYVNTYRRRLLKQGVIGERGRKSIGIDLPMFKDFLREKLEL